MSLFNKNEKFADAVEILVSQKGNSETLRKLLFQVIEILKEQKQSSEIKEAVEKLATGEIEAAENIFRKFLENEKSEGPSANKKAAATARHLGALAYLRDTKPALNAYEQAVELDPENPDGWIMLGKLQTHIGETDAAIESFNQVRAIVEKTKDKEKQAMAYENLGNIYRSRGELTKAEEFYNKTLEIDKDLGSKEDIAHDYWNLGVIYKTRWDWKKAEEFYNKALEIDEELERKEGMASDYCSLGVIYDMSGDLNKAEEFYNKALEINKELGNKEHMAINLLNLGFVIEEQGKKSEALEYWKESEAVFRALPNLKKADEVRGWIDGLEGGS